MPDYSIPVWHPVVVHFPIALLLVGGGAALVWAVRGTRFWHGVALLLVALGTAGALIARETGETVAAQSEGVPVVDALVGAHGLASLWTLVLGVLATAGLGIAWALERRGRSVTWPARALGALVALGAAGSVAWTAHLGGLMVWGVPG